MSYVMCSKEFWDNAVDLTAILGSLAGNHDLYDIVWGQGQLNMELRTVIR